MIDQSSRAYYDIASSRFLDVLCQSTYVKLFDTCKDDLVGVIRDNLRIFGDDGEYCSAGSLLQGFIDPRRPYPLPRVDG